MKSNLKLLLSIAASVLSVFGLTSCDENATIDVPGPLVDFTFEYDGSVLPSAQPQMRTTGFWVKLASDTLQGESAMDFLSKDSTNKQYADAIVAATLVNGKLAITTSNNYNFNGVDSVKITYQLEGDAGVFGSSLDLVVGAPNATGKDTIYFNDLRITKEQALEMINKKKIATMSAFLTNPAAVPNWYGKGNVIEFKFTAESVLSVKVLSALGGGLGL